MSLEEMINDILAHYWLKENPYCSMASTEIYKKLPEKIQNETTIHDVRLKLDEMKIHEKIFTRHVYDDVWASPTHKLLEPYVSSREENVGRYTKQLRLGES
ncbi:MAG: hypothetical protein V1915_05180 [Candidatus Bathyarchaeota archaeon]